MSTYCRKQVTNETMDKNMDVNKDKSDSKIENNNEFLLTIIVLKLAIISIVKLFEFIFNMCKAHNKKLKKKYTNNDM